ncbi:MAG: HAMP domain-containing histidine kinase [Acidobacteriota bacterium]|nr:HAMP domain-containing histidine kinase [Acidobacteriota bacterium]
MSLHRRITAAATFAVAAVCLIFAPASYLFTRAKMVDGIKQELRVLAGPYLGPHNTPPQGAPNNGAPGALTVPGAPQGGAVAPREKGSAVDKDDRTTCASHNSEENAPEVRFGGATGHFQAVCPDGKVIPIGKGVRLPVTKRVLNVAETLTGAYFFSTKVDGRHLEIYVVPDVVDHKAIEGDLPLATVDSTLHGLLITYGLMVAGGILLAGLLGALVARSALAPIRRFTSQTEQVTSALDKPRRLDEEGAVEIRRLAASFNQTLGALERSVEAQRHLIADASHELRTPIAALRSNIQIFLEADQLPPEEQAGLRDAIMAELDDLTQLVSDVLALARGAAPNEAVEELELDAVVREATERAVRRSPNVRFETELESTLIVNSPDRVNRAVTNVIDNARRWSPPDATVEISLAAGVLTVRDHGPGFRDEDLAHVFERFYRSDDARRMPGSGLGLAIVKQAAEAHGGYATAVNAPDGGAIVTVSFGSVRSAPPSGTPILGGDG